MLIAGAGLLILTACSGNQKKTEEANAEIAVTREGINTAEKQLSAPELDNSLRESLLTIYEAYLPDTINPKIKNSLVLSADSVFQLAMYNFEQRRFIQEPLQGEWALTTRDTVTFVFSGNNIFMSNKAAVDYDNQTLTFDTPSGKLTYKAVP